MTTESIGRTTGSEAVRSSVIIGGGVLGSALFAELAGRGVHTTLVDSGAEEASYHSLAWINAAAPTNRAYYALRLQGVVRHLLRSVPLGLASFGGVLSWEDSRLVEPVQGMLEAETVASSHTRLVDLGHSSELLTREQALRIDPALNPVAMPLEGIQYSEDEGWVDLPGLIQHFRQSGVRAGGKVVPRQHASFGLSPSRETVDRVILTDGTSLQADTFIVAAGAETYRIVAEAGVEIPENNSRGLIARSQPIEWRKPRAIVRTPDLCARPDPAGAVTFHSTAAEARLFPVGAESIPARTELNESRALEETGEAMLDEIRRLYDAPELELDRIDIADRPVPGDGLPVVGQTSVQNLHVLASHSGGTVALVLAELLARSLCGGHASALLSPFTPRRFD